MKWKLVKIIALNLVLFLVILTGIEVTLEIFLNHPKWIPDWLYPAMRRYYHEYDCTNIQMDPNCAHFDPALFYLLNPGQFEFNNREFKTTYHVNSLGLRDDESALDSPKIIALGDSYTMGWGVNQNATYPELLAQKLGTPILNAGISSYGTAREMELLKRVNTDSLQVLILQYCPNDKLENHNYVEAGHSLKISSKEIYLQASQAHMRRTDYFPFKHFLTIPKYFKPTKPIISNRPSSVKAIDAAADFVSILKESRVIPDGTEIILFSLEAERSNNHFTNRVSQIIEQQNELSLKHRIQYLNMNVLISNSEHRFVLDPHLNPSGHRILATHLLEILQSNNQGISRIDSYDY